nr:cytochrome c oxidase subunit 2 [Alcedoecus sp.]
MHSFWLVESCSPMMSYIYMFHDHVMLLLVGISSMIIYFSANILWSKFYCRSIKHIESLELIWTVIPAGILVMLAGPSLVTLYLVDEVKSPQLSMKIIGHQWYWSYEYDDFSNYQIDSFMTASSELDTGEFRLLEVDDVPPLPVMHEVRLIITSSDVIHSWTIPSLGVKADAIPGRLNQAVVLPNKIGLLYGQCSEICGAYHSFMPICVSIMSESDFLKML